MCATLGRGGNINSCDRRMCSDTQGIHPSRKGCVRINKREGERMLKRLGKEEEKKHQECRVEEHKPQMDKYITMYL